MTEPAAWPDAALAAVLCAGDPAGLGGVVVRARAGPLRERWLALLRGLLPVDAPLRRLPIHADEHRVFGGLDLAATLAAGRPVVERGLLAEAAGGLLLISMAERMPVALAGRLAAALDRGSRVPGSGGFGMVALDEGLDPAEQPPAALRDRLAFWITLDDFDPSWTLPDPADILGRMHAAPSTRISEAGVIALCETAAALGIVSLRAPAMALRVARLLAALAGRTEASDADVGRAARLVLSARATRLPEAPPAADQQPSPDQADPDQDAAAGEPEDQGRDGAPRPDQDRDADAGRDTPVGDVVLDAARAAIPAGLLDRLRAEAGRRPPGRAEGRAGPPQAATRGRPVGQRSGAPRGGARLDLIATLRAAAPWQRLRAPPASSSMHEPRRLAIRRDDLRVTRFKQRGESTTILVVDASGSLMLNRLAEAKGAALLLLAECYVRRDEVALLAFRGTGTALLLPPTRSLTRARRCLADLPGGGATPLASAIDAAVALADAVRRKGRTPVVVFLTDGRANVARDGSVGRTRAEADVGLAAAVAATTGLHMLVVDMAPRPQPAAQGLASALRAAYLALPRAEAGTLSRAVLAASRA